MIQEHCRIPSSGRVKKAAPRAPAANGVKLSVQNSPILLRLPPVGAVDPYWSRNRSAWNEVILPTRANGFNPPVKSIVERKPGTAYGRRFIVFESARAYFEKLAAQTEEENRKRAAQTA